MGNETNWKQILEYIDLGWREIKERSVRGKRRIERR